MFYLSKLSRAQEHGAVPGLLVFKSILAAIP